MASDSESSPVGKDFPYAERYGVLRAIPEEGLERAAILSQIAEMARGEDAFWETGKCSGTMYRGDLDHYEFLAECFAPFAHVNALQRDMCPSATRFEGEIIAMALDLMHAAAVAGHHPADEPCGSVTGGGTDSIVTALLAYRNSARSERGIEVPNIVLPRTAHPAFHKGCHMFGIEVVNAPVGADITKVDVDFVADNIDDNTIAVVGSAGNYPYGTIDPIDQLAEIAEQRGVGLHVDGCLGGFILPWGEELGYDVPIFDFRLPGVTTISADTHKYGYGFKGTSTLLFRSKELRKHQYFLMTDWPGGKYFSPGLAGSRSGGLLAATWASMASLGRNGYREIARQIFETAFAMQEIVRGHRELRILGDPTFCFSFNSDEFDIYHVNDFMRQRGWRFNGQQYPNAIHMCVTGPQTQPGVVEAFASDLAEAVGYAKDPPSPEPFSGAVYGGVPGGPTPEADDFIRDVMVGLLDKMQSVP
ncbi:MAG: putative sphingosine-1-phosphate lyase [Acidimicrobiales bacterium]|nr:putative sphingosine-1-phosphate lyase [Acidimicrobiales bacterium]RIK08578.1 MAG: aspartate aminotransferase family protein [Acidobacteriota bacterium]